MDKNIVQKVLDEHLVKGRLVAGKEIAIKVDDALLQDATGTTVCLVFEKMNVSPVKTERTVVFIDHNTLQTNERNRNDHKYLQSIAAKHGMMLSRAGNGICHQVFMERFAKPGKTLLGSDSHTPTAGGVGELSIGAGGLDVARALAGEPYYVTMPEVVQVQLLGELPAFVSAKDIVLKVLEILGTKGGTGKALEYTGEGIKHLTVTERATITNMGTETGATMSIFPSDEETLKFLTAQDRASDWQELKPDQDARYDKTITIFLNKLEPLVACPHSPGNIKKVSELEGLKIEQVMLGSCTNSSLLDMKKAALILQGRKVHPDVDLVIAPGSKQVLLHLTRGGELEVFIKAGARILECTCGPCVGIGQAPGSKGVTLRTTNRNFEKRSGTADAEIYLVSPETAAASAIAGKLVDPRRLKRIWSKGIKVFLPEKFHIDDSRILKPPKNSEKVKIIRGPTIVELPEFPEMPQELKTKVLIKLGDKTTTGHISPSGTDIMALRSDLPEIAKHTFHKDPDFYQRAIKNKKKKGLRGIVVGGENYGEGSSREHAALAPRYLGIDAVLVKSFARIHLANLINFGILPLEFVDKADYDRIETGNKIEISDVRKLIGKTEVLKAKNVSKGFEFEVKHCLSSPRQVEIVQAGGYLNWMKKTKK